MSADFKTWTFKLRAGLKFHDDEPVRSKDVRRQPHALDGARQRWASMIKTRLDALEAVDDRTFRFRLEPALRQDAVRARQEQHAVRCSSCRSASPRPIRSSRSPSMSAPARCTFNKDEWVPGASRGVREIRRLRAARRKAELAVRRQADQFRPDRVEDPAGRRHRLGRAAERRGRLVGDAVARPGAAAEAERRASRSISPIRWAISARSGSTICIRRSTTCARAARCRSRSARKTTCAPSSATTKRCGRTCPASSRPDTPLYTEDGGEPLKGKRDIRRGEEAARRGRLQGRTDRAAGRAPTSPITKAQGDVTADLLKQIGMNVEYAALGLGHRRRSAAPARKPSTRAAGTSSTPGTPAPIA